MPSSYELRGHSIGDIPPEKMPKPGKLVEEEPKPIGPYETFKEAWDAGFFETAMKNHDWILMDTTKYAPEHGTIKLQITKIIPRSEALGINKEGSEKKVRRLRPKNDKEELIPMGQTKEGSIIPIYWDSGCNFRCAPKEASEK